MARTRPNILFIMCDQMRHDCGGFASPDRFGFAAAARTPALDCVAQQGVVFENAYCASPQCSPARASWLTGLLPHAHGQMLNYGLPFHGRLGYELRRDAVTITDLLSATGYRCGLAGPWHLGGDIRNAVAHQSVNAQMIVTVSSATTSCGSISGATSAIVAEADWTAISYGSDEIRISE